MSLTVRIAAKPLVCYKCGNLIPAGHKYWKNVKPGRYQREEHINCADYKKQSKQQHEHS